MSKLSKSPLAVARQAYAAGQQALPRYASKYGRRDFTCAQLFVVLVPRKFFKTDCRGVIQYLAQWAELWSLPQPFGLNALGHQGLYHDEETGAGAGATLVYNRARMLHTRLGRFTQRDPLGYVDGMSGYEYAKNKPTFVRDPSGTTAIADAIAWHMIKRLLTWGLYGEWLRMVDYDSEIMKSPQSNAQQQSEAATDKFVRDLNHKGKLFSAYNRYEIPTSNDLRYYTGQWTYTGSSVFSGGWWLNGAHRIARVRGFVDVKCAPNRICYQNRDIHYLWIDKIDGHSFSQAYHNGSFNLKTMTDSPFHTLGALLEALIGDGVMDKGLGMSNFWMEIRFIDGTFHERCITP